jgi:rare lipoprotein A
MKNITIILIVMFLMMLMGASGVVSSSSVYKGMASWYSEEDPGVLKTTANMEHFDDTKLTCAMWDIPFNTIIKVTNLKNGKYVLVRLNDRGPARKLVKQGRIIDLTKEAFSKIEDLDKGLVEISAEIM